MCENIFKQQRHLFIKKAICGYILTNLLCAYPLSMQKHRNSTHSISSASVSCHLFTQRFQEANLIHFFVSHHERAQPLLQLIIVPKHQTEYSLTLFSLFDVYHPLDRTERHQLHVLVRFYRRVLVNTVSGVGRF